MSRLAPRPSAWSPAKRFRFIAIDTLCEGGVAGPGAEGNIDDPQFQWLERQLKAGTKADELIVLFGHHPIRSLECPDPDEAAPPCTSNDAHGHDRNPGCDVDPRGSEPLHLGPGDVRLAHAARESVPVADLDAVTRSLALLAMRYCGTR